MNEKEFLDILGEKFIECIPEILKIEKFQDAPLLVMDCFLGCLTTANTLPIKALLNNLKFTYLLTGRNTDEIEKLKKNIKTSIRVNVLELETRLWRAIRDFAY